MIIISEGGVGGEGVSHLKETFKFFAKSEVNYRVYNNHLYNFTPEQKLCEKIHIALAAYAREASKFHCATITW